MTEEPASSSARVIVAGFPLDSNSSFLRGPAGGPARIREILHSGMMSLSTESGVDLAAESWNDIGDIALPPEPAAIHAIESTARNIIDSGARLLALGGDHSVTYPLVRAHAVRWPKLTILHIDAHPDLYEALDDNPHSHASPFTRVMESGLASRLVQVGIRTMNPEQRRQAERFGVEVISMRDFRPGFRLDLQTPLYISLDLDALDPAFAPGVSHHEPGGLSVREVLDLLWSIDVPIVGADIVEYNPVRDVGDVTAAVGAKLYKELLALLLTFREAESMEP